MKALLKIFLASFLLLVLATSIFSCHQKENILPQNGKDSLYIFVMAGQSNMAGRGIIEAQDTITSPFIYTIDSGENFVFAQEPLNRLQPGLTGLDCGMSFAQSLLPSLPKGTKICLVPCAIGNTFLEEWLEDSDYVVPLYTNMLTRTRKAMQRGVLKGILWHQGEANAGSLDEQAIYQADFTAFIQKCRKDLSDDSLAFYAGTLAPWSHFPYIDSINSSLLRVEKSLPFVYIVSSVGLSAKPDSVHFDASGQRGLGKRFADAVKQNLR
ncbi:MAG: sialate O-acetylesterase [Chitinophagaceae bacterium]